EAFDVIATARRAGASVAPQPYFENFYYSGATASIANSSDYDTAFTTGNLGYLQRALDLKVLSGSLNGPILTNLQVPELLVRTSSGVSNYHGLIVALRRQYASGLAFDFSYTLSRSLDQSSISTQSYVNPLQSSFYPKLDYGPSLFDIRHLFKANGVYEL